MLAASQIVRRSGAPLLQLHYNSHRQSVNENQVLRVMPQLRGGDASLLPGCSWGHRLARKRGAGILLGSARLLLYVPIVYNLPIKFDQTPPTP